MSGRLPPAPPDDDDRERAWIVEGLRQALGRATARELTRLTSLLEPVADGEGNVAGWLVMLFADEMGRQFVPLDSSSPGAPADTDGRGIPKISVLPRARTCRSLGRKLVRAAHLRGMPGPRRYCMLSGDVRGLRREADCASGSKAHRGGATRPV
jgi:hypothetical protein